MVASMVSIAALVLAVAHACISTAAVNVLPDVATASEAIVIPFLRTTGTDQLFLDGVINYAAFKRIRAKTMA